MPRMSASASGPRLSVELAERLFRWDEWANRAALESIRTLAPPPERALGLMAHIAGASWLWLSRVEDEPSPLAVWPALGPARIAEELDAVSRAWAALLRRLPASTLSREIAYTNSKGEPWTSRLEDVLLHVSFHGERHRGQIAAEVRAAGGEPAYTDYIHAVRSGLVP